MFLNLKKIIKVSIVTSALLSTQLLADYYVMVNSQRQGPLTVQQIGDMAATGSVTSNSMVWEASMSNWGKAGNQQELKNLFAATPPPPPPPAFAPPPPPQTPPAINQDNSQGLDEDQNTLVDANTMNGENPQTLNDWKSDFEQQHDITIGITKDGKTFFFGEAIVKVNPLDPAYAKELVFAYDKAILSLQSNFILQSHGNFVAQSVSDYFENDSTNASEFAPVKLKKMAAQGKISLILDKMVDVVDNKLDNLLIEQGVSPSEIQKQTVEQKKLLFKDNFNKKMTKKAFASMSGLVPIQTKILTTSRDGKKVVRLGVIAIMSDKTIQFAKDSSKRRPTHVKGKPSNVRKLLPNTNEGFLDEIGLRYLYDEKGRPMLLAYGRWSVVGKTSNPARYERKILAAKSKARMQAESYIGEFMKSNIDVTESLDAQSVSEEIAKKVSTIDNNKVIDTQETRDDISETLDVYFKKIQKRSKFKLRGTSQIKTWEAKDANGILHVGSVMTWTYDQLENANNIVNGTKRKQYSRPQQKRVVKDVSRSSRVVNSMDDF